MTTLPIYLAQDRLRALARGESLPSHTNGSALFADISGFTTLTEVLRNALGNRRGAEEVARRIEAVHSALITQIELFGGSVIDFAGNFLMLCWFDDDLSLIAEIDRRMRSSRRLARSALWHVVWYCNAPCGRLPGSSCQINPQLR